MRPEKIFADTNLFLRYLTNDIPQDADAVEQLLRRAMAGELILVTNVLILAEIVWTLESFYHLPRPEIKKSILAILNTPGLDVVDSDLILQAVVWYADRHVDFIDAFNAAWMHGQGLKVVCTFDRKHFARLEGIQVLIPAKETP